MRDHIRFLGTFLRNPLSVGAIAPSSRWLARRMVEDLGVESAGTVVELGPGTGAFTGAALERVRPEASFIAVERDPGFAASLESRHPRARVISDSAERLPEHLRDLGLPAADVVLSGLPWASFPESLQHAILGAVVESLRPGGRFATFAYIHAAWFPTARKFRALLEERFADVSTTPVVWRNLPPAFVYRCTR